MCPNLDGYDDWDRYAAAGGIHALSDDDFAASESVTVQGDLYPEDDEN